jgi:hypothetical protein
VKSLEAVVAWSSALCYRGHLPTSPLWWPRKPRTRHATILWSESVLAPPRAQPFGTVLYYSGFCFSA